MELKSNRRLALLALASGAAGGAVVWIMQKGSFSFTSQQLTFEQFAALLLGVAALFLALVGILVAVVALFGFAVLRGVVESRVKGHFDTWVAGGAPDKVLKNKAAEYFRSIDVMSVLQLLADNGKRRQRDGEEDEDLNQ